MDRRPGYYAVIPADVRYDDRIPANAKLLYGEISALISAEGYCYASNAYFAAVYQISERTVSSLISKLQKCNYIELEMGRNSERRIYLKVSSCDGRPVEEIFEAPRRYFLGGIENIFQHTNLSNTDIDKENIKENAQSEETKPTKKRKNPPKEDFDPFPLFIDWIGKNFSEHPRDEKNALYQALVDLCDSRKENGHPIKSQASVTALCNRLVKFGGGSILTMIDLLSVATSSGWRTVFPRGNAPQSMPPKKKERDVEWL